MLIARQTISMQSAGQILGNSHGDFWEGRSQRGGAWATLNSDTSRPFDKPTSGRIAVKVINHLGDEVMKVFKVA